MAIHMYIIILYFIPYAICYHVMSHYNNMDVLLY